MNNNNKKLKLLLVGSVFIYHIYSFPVLHFVNKKVKNLITLARLEGARSADAIPGRGGESFANNNIVMKQICGLSDIVNCYDTFILDMWGVLHDGKKPYMSALHTLQQLHEQPGKRLVILSNSSKRLENSATLLRQMGFDVDGWFDQILTSGEWTHQRLNDSNLGGDPWLLRHLHGRPRTCYVLGSGDGDRQYIESCKGWTMVDTIAASSLLLARGTFTVHETVDQRHHLYNAALTVVLQQAAERKLPMVVANPDFIRPDSDRSPMPGSIGMRYQRILAESGVAEPEDLVYYIGKPFPVIYDAILPETITYQEKRRVCMIGDALETDILGGQRSGIDTVWVTADGIHGCDSKTAHKVLNDWNRSLLLQDGDTNNTYSKSGEQIIPTYQMDHFQW